MCKGLPFNKSFYEIMEEDEFEGVPPDIRERIVPQIPAYRTLFGAAARAAENDRRLWWVDGNDYANPEGIMELDAATREGRETGAPPDGAADGANGVAEESGAQDQKVTE